MMRDAPIWYTNRLIIFSTRLFFRSFLEICVLARNFRLLFAKFSTFTPIQCKYLLHNYTLPIANATPTTPIDKIVFAVSKSISSFWAIYLFHYVWCEVSNQPKKKDRLRIRSNQSIVSAASQFNFNVRLPENSSNYLKWTNSQIGRCDFTWLSAFETFYGFESQLGRKWNAIFKKIKNISISNCIIEQRNSILSTEKIVSFSFQFIINKIISILHFSESNEQSGNLPRQNPLKQQHQKTKKFIE